MNSGMVLEIQSTRRPSRQPWVTTDFGTYGYSMMNWWGGSIARRPAFSIFFHIVIFESYSIKTRREIFITVLPMIKKEIQKNSGGFYWYELGRVLRAGIERNPVSKSLFISANTALSRDFGLRHIASVNVAPTICSWIMVQDHCT